MASCLVTGGQGFIGSALVRSLLEDGHSVTVLDLPEPAFRGLDTQGIADRVRLVEGDVAAPEDTATAVEGIEKAFHLAAVTLVGPAAADPVEAFRVNVAGTWCLLEALRKVEPATVVVASSDKAYGPSPSLPYREEDGLVPASPYEGSKAACDVIARSYHRTYDLPVAVTRLANVYGGGDLNFSRLVPELMAAAVHGRAPRIRSDGTPQRDFLHVSDAVAGYRAVDRLVASGSGHGEAFNMGTGRPVSVDQVVELVSRISGRQLQPDRLTPGGAAGEIDEQFVSSEKLRAAADWTPSTGVEEGFHEAYEWYAAHRDLLPQGTA